MASAAGLANGQTLAKPAASDTTIAPVIITARKRSEDLLKTPVAVSALSAADIAARNIETFADLSNYTPGLTVDQSLGGAARSDRSFQELIIRGMNPSSITNPTTSIFINGVPVSTADLLQNIDDVDHVEVLKGPQSAYFGRETFAGAVNVVTRAPSNVLGGSISVGVGTRDNRSFSATLSGPLIEDKLSFLAGLSYDAHDGSYKNAAAPGQLLGGQSTKSGRLEIVAHPINNLTIKAFGEMLQDDDGPAATGLLLTSGPYSQANCNINTATTPPVPTPYFCGTLPGLNSSVSPAQNTTITPAIRGFLNSNSPALGKIIPASAQVNGFGLRRDAYHVDLNIEYDMPSLGLTLTSLSGFNYDDFSELSDLSNLDPGANGGTYPGFPFMVENVAHDASEEVRLATNQSLPYRGTIGASYVSSITQQGLGGPQYGGFFSGGAPTGAKTTGVFFSLAYDVIPQLTLDFDGRYQIDDEFEQSYLGSEPFEVKYYNFLPRAIIQYKITPDVMTYFTYSEGVNPGTFNAQIAGLATTISPNAYDYFTGKMAGGYDAGVVVQPEKLSNLELGLKGKFLDGRATVSMDIYYDKWTNQLVSRGVTLPPLFAANGVTINPDNVPQLVEWTDNSGQSTMKGFEFDGKLVPIDHVTLNASAAINDANYDKFECIPCDVNQSDVSINASGKQLPNAPRYSGTVGLEYDNSLDMLGAASWFGRIDYVYKQGVYLEASNTVKTPDINLVNLHAGISWPKVSLEGYVTNLFNNKSYVSGFPDDNFTNFTGAYNAFMVGLPILVTVGAKLKYKF